MSDIGAAKGENHMDEENHSQEQEEEGAIRAEARRRLQTKLMAAGLLNSNKKRSDEGQNLEKIIRQEAQSQLDKNLHSFNDKKKLPTKRIMLIDHRVPSPFETAFGPYIIEELREDALNPQAPPSIRQDWSIIVKWLGSSGEPLTSEQKEKIGKGFRGYLAIGEPPSEALREFFEPSARDAPEDGSVIVPPQEVRDVFDRLLATDEEISKSRKADRTKNRPKIDSDRHLFQQTTFLDQVRNLPPRKFLFLNAIWAIAVALYAWIFEPFDGRGLGNLDSDEINRLIVICFLPLAGWLGSLLYKKLD